MSESFYVPTGADTWLATSHTTGPWDARAQHGGPPSALLGRAMQRCEPRDDMIIARFTCEILHVIPVGEIAVRARLARPGRSVELLEAVVSADGREVARATAWRVRRTDSPPVVPPQPAPPPLPGDPPPGAPPPALPGRPPPGPAGEPASAPPGEPPPAAPAWWVDGYLSAMEWRPVRGRFAEPGPATVWGRMRYPLVPDEEPGPLERVLTVADSGNGVSGALDFRHWQFINPELTVHLHREAAGEWICLDAQTGISTGGAGLATSVLSDLDGQVGVGAQSLLVVSRRPG
ncbi:MAG TPA: thioesterase family protein [Streptosporangiaceae bacterium]|nr:thioesterase family protein [Streptosporangiaceae bacterium]